MTGNAPPVSAPAPARASRRPLVATAVLTGLALLVAWQALQLLVLLFIAILIAVYLAAFADTIQRRTRWPRGIALAAAIAATIAVLWGVEALFVPPVIEQVRQLGANLPGYVVAWQAWLGRTAQQFPVLDPFIGGERQHDVVDAVLGQAEAMAAGIFPRVVNLVHGLINVASTAVMAIYLARAPLSYVDFAVSLVPPAHRGLARDVGAACGVALRHWVFAQLFNMAVLGTLTTIGLWALGVPYWLAFGIFAGLAAIVPFFGTMVSTIVPALFVLDRGAGPAIAVALLGTVVHVVEANIIAPMVFERGINLPPVLTIMAVLVAGTLLGPVGLVVAVPLLAVLLVAVRKVLLERIYRDEPIGAGAAQAVAAASPAGRGAATE
ncbi:MAG: AI-2E family transporter [Gemmatimonadaceae bacterium]|nr:AI-2E family transporter [Gemmatimonadaceae bacterium]